jgi:hypothetical protein
MFELEVEDPVQQKLVIFLLDEGAPQEFQVLGCTKLNLEVSTKIQIISFF